MTAPTVTVDNDDQVLIHTADVTSGRLAGDYFRCDTCGLVIDVTLHEATPDELRALADWLDQRRTEDQADTSG